jgi:Lon protease-like protein
VKHESNQQSILDGDMSEQYELRLFPLNTVLFPGMVLPLHIFEERYKQMISECIEESQPFGVILVRSGSAEGTIGDIYDVGTTAQIAQVDPLPDGRMNILALGQRRFRIHQLYQDQSYLTAVVEDFPEADNDDYSTGTNKATQNVSKLLSSYLEILKEMGTIDLKARHLPNSPEALAYLVAIILHIPNDQKQSLLSIADIPEMLNEEYHLLKSERDILRILGTEQTVFQDEKIPYSLN